MSRRNKGEIAQLPLWMPVFMLTALLALGAVLATVLRHSDVSRESAADRAFRSALLPDDWKTFSGDVWSIGYPGDWKVATLAAPESLAANVGQSAMFAPPSAGSEANEYFSIVQIEGLTIDAIIQQTTEGTIAQKSEFLFAGYPAVKYTLANGSVVHYVEYGHTVYAITTEHYNEAEVGIMLATFQFNVKE